MPDETRKAKRAAAPERRIEDERRELETRFTSLVKNIRDHSIFTLDPQGRITSWNREAERILGYSEAEAIGQHFSIIFSSEDLQAGIPGHELRTAMSNGRAEDERWHIRKGGERFWALGIVTPTQDARGAHTGFSKILRDMTDRKQAEEALHEAHAGLELRVHERTAKLSEMLSRLQEEVARRTAAEHDLRKRSEQLRALAGEQTRVEQRERQRIAKLLHDHLQQLLISAGMRLAGIAEELNNKHRDECSKIGQLLRECQAACRTLTADLTPTALYEEGLPGGLQWLVQQMAERHGLSVEVVNAEDVPSLPNDVTLLLFESIRELLFNVVKYAGVQSAQVEVAIRQEQLRLTVSDQGEGFSPDNPKRPGAGGLGLFGIRERLELIGGRMEIDSSPGQGSRITLIVPWQDEQGAPVSGEVRA